MSSSDVKTETFYGNVKYTCSSTGTGSGKWKSGAIIFDKDDERGWLIRMKFDCSENSVVTLKLSSQTLKKYVCKDSVYLDVLRDRECISLYLRPRDKRVTRHIEQLCTEVLSKKVAGAMNNSEVCISSTPAKSGLFTQFGSSPQVVKSENSPTTFTSVKAHKKELKDEEGKENVIGSYSTPSEQFLRRSSEKSRQCLGTLSSSSTFYGKTSTPAPFSSSPKWLSKRGPGLMPDPTPNKRPRLSDSIPYSMKVKPAQPAETNNQQPALALEGFSNLGNTCYMNAILQSLFGLETFSSDLMANKKMLRSFQQQSLCCALIKLLHVKRQATTTSDSLRREALRRVKSAISTTAKRFSGYGQHDAHEFLGQVLDQLKEEVLKVSKATPTPNKENEGGVENKMEINDASPYPGNNPITVNFEFEVLHTLTCLQCQEQVTKTEQFHDISLDVPKQKDLLTPRSLQDALSLFFKNEQIDYTCEKCGHGKSDVSHKITRLPRIFILHLKRYTYNQTFSKNTKMGQNVMVPTYLTMQHHCTEETQPAFPPAVYNETTQNQSKLNNSLDDSREDLPSRRRLEYPGFKNKTISKDSEQKEKGEVSFTETKEKKDEVDGVLTLEDEDDPELSRAIEMSLKEQEEKEQICKDYGEDCESNFERVLELSRQEHKHDGPAPRAINQMSEEEQLELAIQQSLMENDPYNHSNITYSDDVIENGDHMFTRNSDVIGRGDHSYTESYDIGPDGDNFNRYTKGTQKSYSRRRFLSEGDLNEKFENESENSENTKIKENLSRTTDSKRDKFDNELRNNDKESLQSEKCSRSSDLKVEYDSERLQNTINKDWKSRTGSLSSSFSSNEDETTNNDLLCSEDMPDNFDFELENNEMKNKCPGKVYEVHEINDFSEDVGNLKDSSDKNKEFDLNKSVSEKTTLGDRTLYNLKSENKSNTENCFENSKSLASSVKRECQLSTKEGYDSELPKQIGKDEFVFMSEDEDDSWLSQVEDKENKVPLTDTPKLSDPSEFATDTNERTVDEVDGIVEENIDIPDIKNIKGDLPYSYRLVSIVNHMGTSSVTGHYLSDVYDMKKKSWFSFDDSRVSKVTEEDVKSKRQRSGYIFFYMSKEIFDDLSLQHSVDLTSKKVT